MKRTLLVSGALALVSSFIFYLWISADTRAERRGVERARQLVALRAALLGARGASGVAALERQATLSKLPSVEALGVQVVSGPTELGLVTPVATIALVPPVPLVRRDDSPLRDAFEDDWLVRQGMVSQRALERRAVNLLLAAYGQPDVCPAVIRVAGAVELGRQLDTRIAATVKTLVANTQAIEPLCRRERQWHLAEEAVGKPLPFAAGLFLRPIDRVASGYGGRAAMLLQGMAAADDAWEPRALAEGIPVLLGQLAHEDALIADAYRAHILQPSPTVAAIAHRLAPGDEQAVAFEACALNVAFAHSLDPRRLIAELVNAYTTDRWPPEPRRTGALTLLYALSEEEVPKEGAATPGRLSLLLEPPVKMLCTPDPPRAQPVSKDLLEHLTHSLDRSYYIR